MTIIYSAAQIALYIWMIVTYPGYVNDGTTDEFLVWLVNPFNKYMLNIGHLLWLVLNMGSCLVTIYALWVIFATVKNLATTRTNMALNKKSMMLHASLLTVQTLVVLVNTLPHKYIDSFYYRL